MSPKRATITVAYVVSPVYSAIWYRCDAMKIPHQLTATSLPFVATSTPVMSAETRVLDLPLDGKPQIQKRCGKDVLDIKTLCWMSPPEKYSSGQIVGTALPPTDGQRPSWASFGPFRLKLASDGTLEEIEARQGHDKQTEIASSIGARFGLPFEVTNLPAEQINLARWTNKESSVELFCAQETGCKVTFRSSNAEAARLADSAKQQRAMNARPIAP